MHLAALHHYQWLTGTPRRTGDGSERNARSLRSLSRSLTVCVSLSLGLATRARGGSRAAVSRVCASVYSLLSRLRTEERCRTSFGMISSLELLSRYTKVTPLTLFVALSPVSLTRGWRGSASRSRAPPRSRHCRSLGTPRSDFYLTPRLSSHASLTSWGVRYIIAPRRSSPARTLPTE